MKSRKAALSLPIENLVYWVLVVVALIVVFFVASYLLKSRDSYILPSFNSTERPISGLAIVGLNFNDIQKLDRDNANVITNYDSGLLPLYFYTGSKWESVRNRPNFFLGSKEVDAASLRKDLAHFYFETPRFPEDPQFPLNSDRALVRPGSLTVFWDYGMLAFDELAVSSSQRFNGPFLGLDNELYAAWYGVEKVPAGLYGSALPELIRWRDQILQEGPCTKFLALTFNENGQQVTHAYALQFSRTNSFSGVFVDLNKPATGNELYKEGCFIGKSLS